MGLPRRGMLHLTAGAATLPLLPRLAAAQAWPNRPVRWVVGFAPAGGNDIIARLMGQWLSERTGQQFIVENKPGAATNIATEIVVNAIPDGYTILLVGVSAAINATLYDNLSFNFLRDIAPAAGIMGIPLFVATNPLVPASTLPEFIAYAKARPGKINMGSAGIGSAGHLAGELFNMMAGVHLVHVPYRGNGPALAALLGGEVEVVFPTPPSSIEFIRGCAVSQPPARRARRRCRTCRRWPSSFPATRPARGTAWACPRARRSGSSTGSTGKS